MKAPLIADLNMRLALEAPVDAPDSIGGLVRTWSLVSEVWASVRPLSSAQRLAADSAQSLVTHAVTLRWRADVTGAMRLRDGPRIFEILSIADAEGEKRRLVCRCREIL
jgi:SPP1 family predicted phage head-tail adaptor